MRSPSRVSDRFLLGFMRMLPTKLARHLLFLLKSYPVLADRWGYHVRSIHYYDPLPDFREISEANVRRRREPSAIDFQIDAQLALIRRLASAFRPELDELQRTQNPQGVSLDNDYFSGFDAAVYYALIRDLKPARVLEIGSGFSTRIANAALERNRIEGRSGELTCIEPYPEPRLTDAGLTFQLIQQRVEDVNLDLFAKLDEGDILFIDSSHAVKFGGDVCREFLEILPSLKSGVWVHVHDIFFPHDYPAEWLIEKRMAFTEQYLLEAFLAFNYAFSVQVANYWLSLDHADDAAKLWPLPSSGLPLRSTGCGSFWIRKET